VNGGDPPDIGPFFAPPLLHEDTWPRLDAVNRLY